jgi:hypothetical protein
MRKYLTLFLLMGVYMHLSAFEGNVQITRQSQYDTTYFIFHIKEPNVRIDEFSNNGRLIKSYIINLNTENVVALNPALKLYIEMPKKESQARVKQKFDIIKTSNYKVIEGKTCYQWRVRNRELDSEVTYWVTESDIEVMQKLYKILSATEKYSSILSFYMSIPDSDGFIPLVAVERNLLREEKQSMLITSINPRKVPVKLFQIPIDYKSVKFNM